MPARRRRSSFGTIRKSGRNSYRVSYVGPDGRTHTPPQQGNGRALTFPTRASANAWLAQTKADIAAGRWKDPATLHADTLGAYGLAWIRQRKHPSTGKPLAPKTRQNYEGWFRNLKPLHGLALAAITPATLRTWHDDRAQLAPTTAGREMGVLSRIMNTAVGDGLIPKNPVPPELCRSSTGITHKPPTPEQLAALVDAMPARFRLAVLLAAFGGLRLSEWRALERRDLTLTGDGDDARYIVNVHKQALYIKAEGGWVTTLPKSSAGVRKVDLPKHLTMTITEHLNKYVGKFAKALLFPSAGKSKYLHDSAFNRPWSTACEKVGVKGVVREHDLRAYFATHLVVNGATLRDVQGLLGDSTPEAALRYVHEVNRRGDLVDRLTPLPEITKQRDSNITDIQQQRRKAK